jgi:hypothetical protein
VILARHRGHAYPPNTGQTVPSIVPLPTGSPRASYTTASSSYRFAIPPQATEVLIEPQRPAKEPVSAIQIPTARTRQRQFAVVFCLPLQPSELFVDARTSTRNQGTRTLREGRSAGSDERPVRRQQARYTQSASCLASSFGCGIAIGTALSRWRMTHRTRAQASGWGHDASITSETGGLDVVTSHLVDRPTRRPTFLRAPANARVAQVGFSSAIRTTSCRISLITP